MYHELGELRYQAVAGRIVRGEEKFAVVFDDLWRTVQFKLRYGFSVGAENIGVNE